MHDTAATSDFPRRLYVSAFFMDGGFFLMMAAIPFKVLTLNGGSAMLGVVAAIVSLTYVAFSQLTGRWSDRGDRTVLTRAGNLLLIGFALLASRTTTLTHLILLLPIMSLAKALYWPAAQATLGDLSRPGRLAYHTAHFNIAWSSGKTLGFLIGPLVLARLDFATTFLLGAGFVICSLLATVRIGNLIPVGEPCDRDDIAKHILPDDSGITDAAAEKRRRVFLRLGWLANLAANGAAGVLVYHLPRWFEYRGWSEDRFGMVLGLLFLLQTVMFLLLARRVAFAYSLKRLLLPQLLALLALAAIPWFGPFWLFLAAAPLLGIAFGVSYEASIYYSLVARTDRGKNAGIHESLVGLGGFLPPLLGGVLATWSGWLGAPYLLAALGIGLALWAQLALWRRAA
ncbi:MAG: MFS transporter [bacterium]